MALPQPPHSLIEFSNREFYGGDLRIFPSPARSDDGLGIKFRHVPDGVYLRGSGRYNREEARAVAREVIRHAHESSGLSPGVAAFSIAQQRAIEDEIELLRRDQSDDAVAAFFDPGYDESFFVKNLETVQGNERDVILLSVGYGPDATGHLTQNFGPLNRDGGWRRLNVLVTRARRLCVLFSSITSERIRVEETTPRGVRALKSYLQHSQTGAVSCRCRVRWPDLSLVGNGERPGSAPRQCARGARLESPACLGGRLDSAARYDARGAPEASGEARDRSIRGGLRWRVRGRGRRARATGELPAADGFVGVP